MKPMSFAEILLQQLIGSHHDGSTMPNESIDPLALKAERIQLHVAVLSPSHEPLNSRSASQNIANAYRAKKLNQKQRATQAPQTPAASEQTEWSPKKIELLKKLIDRGHIESYKISADELRIQFRRFLKVYHPDLRCTLDTATAERARIESFFIQSKGLFEEALSST